jgi:hypothetical protein
MEMGNMNVPFKRPLLLVALATLIFAATPSRADDFDVTVGRLSTGNNFSGTQVTVAVKNNTAEILKVGTIECGFFRGQDLLFSASQWVMDLHPGQTGHVNVMQWLAGKPKGEPVIAGAPADRAVCRVVNNLQ